MQYERYDAVVMCRGDGTNRMHDARRFAGCKTEPVRRTYLHRSMMEAIMLRTISTIIITLSLWATGSGLWFAQAQASQGPGVTPGSASATTQLATAIVVYGGAALLLAAGLIGAARQRKARS
jgi:hypothetical protein